MYDMTSQQIQKERELNKLGFRFSNWIAAHPDANGDAIGNLGCMVMVKKSKFGREYREIEPDGSVN